MNPVNKNPRKSRNVDKEFAKQLNFKGLKFSVHKEDYAQKEKQINISFGVFGYEDKTAYRIYTSKQTLEKHVDLLLLSNFKNPHYVLNKDFDKFMTKQNKASG